MRFKVFRAITEYEELFSFFSDYDKTLSAYFRITHRELRTRWNKFASLTKPGDFKGAVYRKYADPTKRPATKGPATKGPVTKGPGY